MTFYILPGYYYCFSKPDEGFYREIIIGWSEDVNNMKILLQSLGYKLL
jgi:hypothetical protein